MPQNRKSNSPSDKSPASQGSVPGSAPPSSPSIDEEDITLEEHDDRQMQRPRLPDQRRDKKSFEMGTSVTPAPESSETGPQGIDAFRTFSPDAETTADEIAEFSPDAVETPSRESGEAGLANRTAPAQPAKAASSHALDDLEEFIAKTATEGRVTEKVEKVRRPFTLLEKICSAAGVAVLVVAAIWLISSATSEANGIKQASTPWPDLPIEGSLVTISDASTSWRKRVETDRVGQMEIILPVPGQYMPEVIPQINFTVDGSKSTNGYLRFIFKDTTGKPQGDTRVVKVEGGKLLDMGKGEIVKGGTDGSIYCSYGLLNIAAYRSYEGDDKPRWSVEVSESSDYNADDKDWKILDSFNVRNHLAE